jgi:hypothetical protein
MTDPVVLCRQDIGTERAVVDLCRSEVSELHIRKDIAACMHDTMSTVLRPDIHNTMAPPSSIREPIIDLLSTQARLYLQIGSIIVGRIWMSLIGLNPRCQSFGGDS